VAGDEYLMPAMEHLLLRYLAERHGQIVSRDELVSVAWGQSGSMMSNSLAVHFARVRRRFPAQSGVDWIRSVRGCGYQLIVPVGVAAARSATGG
jgi:two-component system phosphate regulon response regulator PhoB